MPTSLADNYAVMIDSLYTDAPQPHTMDYTKLIQEVLTVSATGTDDEYTLSYIPIDTKTVEVYCNGVYYNTTLYIVSGSSIIFNSVIPVGWSVSVKYMRE